METYAFWRPPVRTLTFEDFTNMQKQQGWLSVRVARVFLLIPVEFSLVLNIRKIGLRLPKQFTRLHFKEIYCHGL